MKTEWPDVAPLTSLTGFLPFHSAGWLFGEGMEYWLSLFFIQIVFPWSLCSSSLLPSRKEQPGPQG